MRCSKCGERFTPIDLLSLLEYMGPRCDPAVVADYLNGCVIEEGHIPQYVHTVREKTVLRSLARFGEELRLMARQHGADPEEIREYVRHRLGSAE